MTTLHDAANQYLVYLQALRLPSKRLGAYQRALAHILWFYGDEKLLDDLDDATILQYVKVYDPFDCDPEHEERGTVFCKFTNWLMQNRLIPAWADQTSVMDDPIDIDEWERQSNLPTCW